MFGFPPTMRVDFVGATSLHPDLSFTRASSAWYFDEDVVLQVKTTNQPRLGAYDFETGVPIGILLEVRATTNVCLHNRALNITHQLSVSSVSAAFTDGEAVTSTGGGAGTYIAAESDASNYAIAGGSGTFSGTLTGTQSGATATIGTVTVCWTPTNITAAKDRTGLDNVANSASSITATGANGTILLARTAASASYLTHAFVRRITGTGAVDMTCDGGTTWTAIDVDTVVSPSGWAMVRIPKQTVTNPSFGFRIQTSGDAIAVDLMGGQNNMLSNQDLIPSPIVVTTLSVTRAIDVMQYAAVTWFNPLEGAARVVVAGITDEAALSTLVAVAMTDGTNNERIALNATAPSGGGLTITDGGVTQANLLPGDAYAGGIRSIYASWKLNDARVAVDGQLSADVACTIPTVTGVLFGALPAGGTQYFGGIRLWEYWNRRRESGVLIAGSQAA